MSQVQAGLCCPGMLRALAPTSQVLGGKYQFTTTKPFARVAYLQEQLGLENLHLEVLVQGGLGHWRLL